MASTKDPSRKSEANNLSWPTVLPLSLVMRASGLAAGCPVIVKAHSSHLGTNELVASAIIKAAQKMQYA